MNLTEPPLPLKTTLLRSIIGMILVWGLAGCSSPQAHPPSRLEFALQDIDGLYGGSDVYVHADDTCIIREIAPGGWLHSGLREHRYAASLPAGTVAKLRATASACHLTAYRQARMTGRPHEARSVITWKGTDNRLFSASKVGDGKSPRFDPVDKALRDCMDMAKHKRTLYNGAYDWERVNLELANKTPSF